MDNKMKPVSNFDIKPEEIKAKKKNVLSDFFDRSSRTFDLVTSEDYRNYKKNSRGMTTDLRAYDQQDLKYLKRDFKIEGIDYSKVDTQIKENKASEKVIKDNLEITPISSVVTDKGKVTVAVNQKTGELKISNGGFLGNDNIPMWTNFSEDKLDKRLRDLGDVKTLDIQNNGSQVSDKQTREQALIAINKGLENTPSLKQNHIKNLDDNEFLRGENIQRGQLVTTQSPIDSERNFKVLSSDKDNIVLARLNDPEQKPVLINRESRVNQNVQQNIDYLAIADRETMLGYNRADNKIYVGTITEGGKPQWQTKDAYLKTLDEAKQQNFSKDLKQGNMIQPFSISKGEDGNFKGVAVNGSERISSDRLNWYTNKEELNKAKSNKNELGQDISSEIAKDAAISVATKSIGIG